MNQPVARAILRSGQWLKADGRVTLGYDARFLRRKRLVAEDGSSFLVDLTEPARLDQGDAPQPASGRCLLAWASHGS